jgi:phage gp36-like protein
MLTINIATYYAWTAVHPKVRAISADELAVYKSRYDESVDALKRIANSTLDIEGLEAIANVDAGEQSAGGFCNFINPEDYDASIHAEILDSLIRANAATLETCEDRAVSEMRSYMRLRYDCDAIFEARGLGRHPLVLMRAIDIAIYHAFCIHNPQKMSTLRLKRYDDAIAWLKEVQTGAAVIDGAPTLDASIVAANGYYRMQSNAKRSNRV